MIIKVIEIKTNKTIYEREIPITIKFLLIKLTDLICFRIGLSNS